MPIYVTFKVPNDRGPEAWERYATDTMQIGPCETEAAAWDSLAATVGELRADASEIVCVD